MKSKSKTSPMQNSGAADFPVRTYRLLTKESAEVSKETGADYSSALRNSLTEPDLAGSLSRTFPDYLIAPTAETSKSYSRRWMNSGMAFRGECWTQNTLEHHSDAEESTLSQVIEASAPLRYFLNREQLQSLLDRASARGTSMPEDLSDSIQAQLSTLSSMPELDAAIRQDPRQRDTEATERLTLLIREAAPTLCVRRMLPSEYETLQGFPPGWTETDTGV